MIVTIDGPAGAGKSSVARKVAELLGFEFLDTGALYRAATLAVIRARVEFTDVEEIARVASRSEIEWRESRVYLDGEDVTEDIRIPTVTDAIRYLADLADVRKQLSHMQRKIAAGRDIVTEGRDQGTEVFPDAQCKVFLTASPEERARRRHQQLLEAGKFMELKDVLQAQQQRDEEDRQRPVGALKPAVDAIVVESDGMTAEEVIDRLLQLVNSARRQMRSESNTKP